MIVVNRACGYIFAEYIFADTIARTPIQAIENMVEDMDIRSTYYKTTEHDNNIEYDVYQVEEDFPQVYDGQDQNVIEKLQKSGKYIASIASIAMEEA